MGGKRSKRRQVPKSEAKISSTSTQPEKQAPIDDDLGEHYFKDFIVTAPVAGQLVERLVDRGMIVKRGQPMFIMKSGGPGQPEVVVRARMDGTVFVLPLKDGNNLDSYQALFYLYDFQKHKEKARALEAEGAEKKTLLV